MSLYISSLFLDVKEVDFLSTYEIGQLEDLSFESSKTNEPIIENFDSCSAEDFYMNIEEFEDAYLGYSEDAENI